MKIMLKWMGGKASKIIPAFPKHNGYIEPFCGGLSIELLIFL